MALVTANNFPVLDGSAICIPRNGAWHADLAVDTPNALAGRVTIVIGDGALTLIGTADADRSGSFVDTARARIVGGAGGMRLPADPKHYTDTSIRIVFGDLLATAGETLSTTADASVLDRSLEYWTTIGLPVRRVIERLMASAAPDAAWRVLPDGTVWVGLETWPDSGLAQPDYQVIDRIDEHGYALLGVDTPTLRPGTQLAGERVSYVAYELSAAGVRIKTWFGDGEHDRFKAAIAGAVKGALPDIEYRVWYEAKVDHQENDVVDVDPGNGIVPSMAKVPVRCGPGMSITGLTGGTVLVGWSGGDPSKPRAFAFDPDGSGGTAIWNMDKIFLAGADGQPTTLGDVVRSNFNLVKDHVHPCTGGTVSVSPTLSALEDPRASHVWVK